MANTTSYFRILKSVSQHTLYRHQCLNLIASENIMSPAAASLLSSDLANRYTVGRPHNRWFPGFQYYDTIEDIAEKISKKLFHARYVNVQAPTGMIANAAVYLAVLKPNDLVLSLPVKHSGHYSHVAENIFSKLHIKVESLPFNEKEYSIDIEKAILLIKNKHPQMIILGTSEFLFPAPIKELRSICTKMGTKILYDASHVSGLVAGQTFQSPLIEGADILTMSTNKTLAAPSHGIIACNDTDQYQARIEHAVVPLLTSNHHAHHVAALALTLTEFEMFGQDYAKKIIANAKILARALYANDITVLCPDKDFTESHTILIDTITSSKTAVQLLAEANIMTNSFQLPWNNQLFESGVRIGTNELTRLNMQKNEIQFTAKLIADILLMRRTIGTVKKDVMTLREYFQTVYYC